MSSSQRTWTKKLFRRPRGRHDQTSDVATSQTTHAVVHTSPQHHTAAQTSEPSQLGSQILEKAFDLLTVGEREILSEYLQKDGDNVDVFLSRVLEIAARQRALCKEKQWKWEVRGHEIRLSDMAENVVSWLDKLKGFGDVATNIDPIHLGLPWAGLRMIFEAVGSNRRQMTALLLGMDMALCFMNRLRVYFMQLTELQPSEARTNFEEAMIVSYACVLGFLARAIISFSRSTSLRMLRAFLCLDDHVEFEVKCNDVMLRLEIEAKNCDRSLSAQERKLASQAGEMLRKVLAQLSDIKSSIDLITASLRTLPVAEGAEFDSYFESRNALCLEHTREGLLGDVSTWIDQPDSKPIFWLRGMAGTGKSTISRTVSKFVSGGEHKRYTKTGLLGASFFFKQGEQDRGNAKKFYPSLAVQLSERVPDMDQYVADAANSNLGIGRKSIGQQFEALILAPLSRLDSGTVGSSSFLLVIDALDECDDRDAEFIIRSFETLQTKLRLRIFVTSRPELSIRLGFASLPNQSYEYVVLHDMPRSIITHDIQIYIRHQLAQIRDRQVLRQPQYPLPVDWPVEVHFEALVQHAVPLFIFAATLCRYIGDDRGDPVKRLNEVLSHNEITNSKMANIYLPVLNQIIGDEDDDPEATREHVRRIIGPLVVLAEPLPVGSMSCLFGIEARTIASHLDFLHSVLNVPTDDIRAPVRVLHLSFRDFILQETHPFSAKEPQMHQTLAARCLDLLSQQGVLRADICNIAHRSGPGAQRKDVPLHHISKAIPLEVAYACKYWIHHFQQSGQVLCDHGQVQQFLERHLLHWLEILSWLGKIYEHTPKIMSLAAIVDPDNGRETLRLMNDVSGFVVENQSMIDATPLQIYCSALLFAPDDSIVRSMSEGIMIQRRLGSRNVSDWRGETWKFNDHNGAVRSVAFSSDENFIASSSDDGTIRVRTTTTGEEVACINEAAETTAFSVDGRSLVTVGHNETAFVRVWDLSTAKEIRSLNIPNSLSVHLSSNGEICCATFDDDVVQVWQVSTMRIVRTMQLRDVSKLHHGKLALSHDGSLIASSIGHEFVLTVDVESGEVRDRIPIRHAAWEMSLSSDDRHLIIWTYRRVYVVNLNTHNTVGLFQGQLINHAALSSNGRLAIGAGDEVLHIWDIPTMTEIAELQVGFACCVGISGDDSLVAIGQLDGSVRLWNAAHLCKPFREPRPPPNADGISGRVVLAPDGKHLAATYGGGQIRLLTAACSEDSAPSDELLIQGCDYEAEFSPSGATVVCWCIHGVMRLREISSRKDLWQVGMNPARGVQHSVSATWNVEFSQDGRHMVVLDEAVSVLRTETGQGISNLDLSLHDCKSLCSTRCRGFVVSIQHAVIAYPGGINIFDLETGLRTHQTSPLPVREFSHLSASCDGRWVAAADYRSGVFIWDIMTAELVRTLDVDISVHNIWDFSDIALSLDARLVAVCLGSNTVKVFDAGTGILVQDIVRHQHLNGPLYGKTLAFNSDGTLLRALGGLSHLPNHNDTAVVWTGISEDWIERSNNGMIWLPPRYRTAQVKVLPNGKGFLLIDISGLCCLVQWPDFSKTTATPSYGIQSAARGFV